jgi:multisubunit Na+/H+ antiporter MnhB subunit
MMSRAPSNPDSRRRWISGLAVTLTTIGAYMAFWHLSPIVTFAAGCVALIAMLVAAWIYGKEPTPPSGK